jgi:hypothetical protein
MLVIYISSQLALNSSYSADFSSFANSSIALMLGVALTGVVCGSFACLEPAGSQADCSEAIGGRWLPSPNASRMGIASRLPVSCNIAGAGHADYSGSRRGKEYAANLRQLRTALSIIDIRRASLGLSRRTRAAIDAFLAHLASVCRSRTIGQLPAELAGRLDRTIAFTLQDLPDAARDQTLIGLAGVRSGLFPEAPAYQPRESEQGRMAA